MAKLMARVMVWVMMLSLVLAAPNTTDTRKKGSEKKADVDGSVASLLKEIDSPIADVQWLGEEHHIVLVLSDKGMMYRSEDHGKTWENQSSKLSQKAGLITIINGIHVTDASVDHVFLRGDGNNWVSHDAGKTFQHAGHHLFEDVHMNDFNPNLLLADSFTKGCHEVDADDTCLKRLFQSEDFGEHWKPIADYIVQYSWSPYANEENTVYASLYHGKKTGAQPFGAWDSNVDFVRTTDFFITRDVLVKRGNRFLFSEGNFLFVAQTASDTSGHVQLLINQDSLATLTFEKAKLPEEIKHHSYTILDTSEKSAFVHVNHHGGAATYGNVYSSGADGTSFTLSLPYNRRDSEGRCDFERVEGLEGIYIANFLNGIKEAHKANRSSSESTHRLRGKHGHGSPRTVISFDKGSQWNYLTAPTEDVDGKPIRCGSEHCHLNLHGMTDTYGPFYTEYNSIGMIMATGSVGDNLMDRANGVNTYLSTDAGLTWKEVARGSHIYEFGDHGSIIVMANDEKPSKEIVYSWNHGASWETVAIAKEAIDIENIVIEPSSTSVRFLVYGFDGSKGVLIALDFGNLHQRVCQGADSPRSSDSDYELWSPNDGRKEGHCLLGRTISYTRRKSSSACFNPIDHDAVEYFDHCPCQAQDFECIPGYARDTESQVCRPLNTYNIVSKQPPSECHDFYEVSKGYRRVAGNTCVGGVEWEPELLPCPVSSAFASATKTLLGMALLGAAVMVMSGYDMKFIGKLGVVSHLEDLCYAGYKRVRYAPVSGYEDFSGFDARYEDSYFEEDPDSAMYDDQESHRSIASDREINFKLPRRESKSSTVAPLQPPPSDGK